MTSPSPSPNNTSSAAPSPDPNRPEDSGPAALFDAVAAEHAALYARLVVDVRNGKPFQAKDHRKVKAATTREDASPFAPLVKYVLGLDSPDDSSTAARYASVVSFLHARRGLVGG